MLYVRKCGKQLAGSAPEWKQRSGLRGPPTPPDVLAHPDPARPPIDPISYAMASAISLLHT
eukprot:1149752-Pelagomonas_calceolata.AAC.3